ncbi:MAG: hypothetical protein RIF46_16680, partial [Cyclobacteriaceae bacterium]
MKTFREIQSIHYNEIQTRFAQTVDFNTYYPSLNFLIENPSRPVPVSHKRAKRDKRADMNNRSVIARTQDEAISLMVKD